MISVAMTTYNGEKFIAEQIRSILDQTHPVDELIICDDMSSDRTISILEKLILENKTNVKIELVRNSENLGYTQNFRKAISLTHGDYVFLCDQDDIWMPNKVERIICSMQQNQIDFLCSNYYLIDSEGNPLQQTLSIPPFIEKAKPGLNKVKFFPLLFGNIAQGCTYCFTSRIRELYLKTNSVDLVHDYQIILVSSILNNCYFLNEKLIKYRIHASNSLGLPPKRKLKKINFHLKYYVPDLARFLKKLRPFVKIPCYYLVMPMIYLKIPVIYLVIKGYLSYLKK